MTIFEKVILEIIKGDCVFSGTTTEERGQVSIYSDDEFILDVNSRFKLLYTYTVKRSMINYLEAEGSLDVLEDKGIDLSILIEDTETKEVHEVSKEFTEAVKDIINEQID